MWAGGESEVVQMEGNSCGQDEGWGELQWEGLTPPTQASMTPAWVSPHPHTLSSQVAKKGCRHLVCSSGEPTSFYFMRVLRAGLGEEEPAGAAVDVQGLASFFFF